MADLDTTSKRRSSVQILATYVLAPPLPDNAIGQGDRQHIAWSYSGILAAGGQAFQAAWAAISNVILQPLFGKQG